MAGKGRSVGKGVGGNTGGCVGGCLQTNAEFGVKHLDWVRIMRKEW